MTLHWLIRVTQRERLAETIVQRPWRATITVVGAVVLGYSLAAIQLVPTYELKQHSIRQSLPYPQNEYGRLPLGYLPQLVAPWHYYAPDVDPNRWIPEGQVGTHRVEAHLYFGLLVTALLAMTLARRATWRDKTCRPWLALGGVSLVIALGWPWPILQQLPGFGYFGSSARYGILVTLAAGLLAALAWQDCSARWNGWVTRGVGTVLVGVTAYELSIVARAVNFIDILHPPIVAFRDQSELRGIFAQYQRPLRMFARGPNSATLVGTAATPVILGMPPTAYADERLVMPQPLSFEVSPTEEQVAWLRRAGVTHIVSFAPLDLRTWPARFIWSGLDQVLNRVWDRPDPIYLYELTGSRGRVAWEPSASDATARIVEYRANSVVISANSSAGGRLVLTDLAFPGWSVTVDGHSAAAMTVDGMFRGVAVPSGRHRVVWTYQPRSLQIGIGFSVCAGLIFLTWIVVAVRRSRIASLS